MTGPEAEIHRILDALHGIEDHQLRPGTDPVGVEDSLRVLAVKAVRIVRRLQDGDAERGIANAIRVEAGTISAERNLTRVERFKTALVGVLRRHQSLDHLVADDDGGRRMREQFEDLLQRAQAVQWVRGMEAQGRASTTLTTLGQELGTLVRNARGINAAEAILPGAASYRGVDRETQLRNRKAALVRAIEKEVQLVQPVLPGPAQGQVDRKSVFIIHGHDIASARHLALWLEQEWRLRARILMDEAGQSKTLIERIEEAGDEVEFAIAIFTPDDVVDVPATGETYAQARPNAIGEWFMCAGRMGRERTCMVVKRGTRLPSDLSGITRLEFGDSIAESFDGIRKELTAADLL